MFITSITLTLFKGSRDNFIIDTNKDIILRIKKELLRKRKRN